VERERRLRISSARRKCITKQQAAGGSGTLKRVTEKISHTYNIQAAGITNRKKIKILVTKVRLVVRKPERGRRRKKKKRKKL
jgi:hypothetical protein